MFKMQFRARPTLLWKHNISHRSISGNKLPYFTHIVLLSFRTQTQGARNYCVIFVSYVKYVFPGLHTTGDLISKLCFILHCGFNKRRSIFFTPPTQFKKNKYGGVKDSYHYIVIILFIYHIIKLSLSCILFFILYIIFHYRPACLPACCYYLR